MIRTVTDIIYIAVMYLYASVCLFFVPSAPVLGRIEWHKKSEAWDTRHKNIADDFHAFKINKPFRSQTDQLLFKFLNFSSPALIMYYIKIDKFMESRVDFLINN